MYNDENESLKNEIKETKEKNNDYEIQLKNYKNHIKLLKEQNEKINKQFEEIIETDDEILKELEKMDYLDEIVNKNINLIKELS